MIRNAELFERACRTIPGGVNSPVRAFRSVGGTPPFIERAAGPYTWDADKKQYIDYVGSWGPAILGHAHPEVIRAVQEAAVNGLSFGAPTEAEIELAEMLVHRLPSIEQVRLVSSGTEATMSAIRLARGYTGRAKIIKFEGCYHGHADSLLVKAGSGLLTFGNPTSAGVPPEFTSHTLVLDYNDIAGVEAAFKQYGDEIACVIVEPVAGNMNLVQPVPGFLQALRDQCTRYGSVLIFDEVMTGFRVGPQGVQGRTGIVPDLTTLAKVIGGATSWPTSPRWAGSTRPARYRATRWPWPPASPPCACWPNRVSTRSSKPRPASWCKACARRPPARACRSAPTTWAACSACTSATRCRPRWPRSRPRIRRRSTSSSTPRWSAA